jgi:hypothetical protein
MNQKKGKYVHQNSELTKHDLNYQCKYQTWKTNSVYLQ